MKLRLLPQLLLILIILSCSPKQESASTSETGYATKEEIDEDQIAEEEELTDEQREELEQLQETEENGCPFQDDTYTAEVEYYNPNTGYSHNYILDVEVEDCQVVQINFPNDGYLDDSHISPADLDEDGNASITDDEGRAFEIHIEL